MTSGEAGPLEDGHFIHCPAVQVQQHRLTGKNPAGRHAQTGGDPVCPRDGNMLAVGMDRGEGQQVGVVVSRWDKVTSFSSLSLEPQV